SYSCSLHCDDNDFCLAHFRDGVARSLAAHAASLDASIGHVVSAVARYFVDVYPSEVEPLRCIERGLQITGEDTGLQAIRCAIGKLDGLIKCIVRGDGDGGTKKFGLADLHGWGNAKHNCRCDTTVREKFTAE